MFILALATALTYGGLVNWIYGLGRDSFLEFRDFNTVEALTLLKASAYSVLGMTPHFKTGALLVGVSLAVSLPLAWLLVRYKHAAPVGLALIFAGHLNLAHSVYRSIDSSREFVQSTGAVFTEPVSGIGQAADVDLIIYVGESTSSLNMSLYGYPLKTTPKLEALQAQDVGFLPFSPVRSTQSHTSSSLLRALSLPSPMGTPNQLWGLGSILASAGVRAKVFSTQPSGGSFASISKFIFDGMDYEPSTSHHSVVNMATHAVKDDELIPQLLSQSGVTVFHSYAGHAPYLKLVESSLAHSLDRPEISLSGMVGNGFPLYQKKLIQDSQDYDRVVGYIDSNLDRVMRSLQVRVKPAVVMYFSDHGESVFTGRSHDSSRYIDEMTTVPFILYFNAAYRKKYPAVFADYQAASKRHELKLLDQALPSILEVLQIESKNPLPIPTMAQSKPHPNLVIMQRETLQSRSSLDFRYDESKGFSDFKFSGGTPEPTMTWIINDQYKREQTICYHRADSYVKALRAATVAECIEFDLVVEGDKLSIYHPPAVATGFELEHMFAIASHRKNKLWIDAKNLNEPWACKALQDYLGRNDGRVGEIFVEFPAESVAAVNELRSCARSLRDIGIRTSYYVANKWLMPCAQDPVKNTAACALLNGELESAMKSGMFTDLSFNFSGYPAMKQVAGTKKFRWNTWTVRPQDFHKFPRQDFSFIIMDTANDPNTY